MAVFSNGGSSSPDVYIGISCLLLVITSSLLNIIVFIHNKKKVNSLARNLFLCLSIGDFLTAWILTFSYAVHVFQDKVEECRESFEEDCNKYYFRRTNTAKFGDKIFGIFSWTSALAPANITAFLAMSRCCQIRFPFKPISIKLVISVLFSTLILLPVLVGIVIFDEDDHSKPFVLPLVNLIWTYKPRIFGLSTSGPIIFLLFTVVTWTLQFGAVVSSLVTIYDLVKSHIRPASGEIQGRRTRSSLKVIITNVGSIMILVSYAIITVHSSAAKDIISFALYFMATLGIPSLTSLLNPLVYITMTPNCLKMCQNALRFNFDPSCAESVLTRLDTRGKKEQS